MSAPHIEVHGLKEMRRELKKLEDKSVWVPELKAAGMAAGEIGRADARRLAAAGATTRSGKHATMGHQALDTIRVLAQQTRVFIAGGKASTPWFAGWEGYGRARQFPPARTDGYNIWPAIERNQPQIVEAYAKGIDPLIKRAFPGGMS